MELEGCPAHARGVDAFSLECRSESVAAVLAGEHASVRGLLGARMGNRQVDREEINGVCVYTTREDFSVPWALILLVVVFGMWLGGAAVRELTRTVDEARQAEQEAREYARELVIENEVIRQRCRE